MIKDLDYKIFKSFKGNKKVSEIYLGHQSFEWLYTKAYYSATCTEAVDFTLFDKTICGLLNIEGSLSLEEIGKILGFNVIDLPSQNKYKDFAEYEILKDALQSLEEYEMITTGDNSYSYCQLTDIGKEYYNKGKKFKVHTNKRFELFFDNTNNDHQKAKENFEFIRSNNIKENSINSSIDYTNEAFLKSFSESQIPNIYNVEKMNSFKDSILISKEHKSTTLYAVFLVDTNTGKYRTVVYDESSKKLNDYFSGYLYENHQTRNSLFYNNIKTYSFYKDPKPEEFLYRDELVKSQNEIERIIDEEENVSEEIANLIDNQRFFEPINFIDNLEKIIQNSENEIWVIINEISYSILEKLKEIVKGVKDKYLFFYLPDNPDLQNEIEDFQNKVYKSSNSYLIVGNIEEFNIITEVSNTTSIYKKVTLPVTISGKSIGFDFIQKYPNVEIKDHINSFKLDFADAYLEDICQEIDAQLSDIINKGDLSEYTTSGIELIDFKLRPFYSLSDRYPIVNRVIKNKKSLIKAVSKARTLKIQATIDGFSNDLKKIELSDENKLKSLKRKLDKAKNNLEKEDSYLFSEIEKKILRKEKEFELIKKRKSIIIDTNILIEEPEIINTIGPLQNIIFSAKVIDELDGLKNRRETKEQAQAAIREIRKNQKNKNVRFATSKVDDLPNDFNKKSPDNLILSVALQYKKRNPILLTNDKGLQIKAELLDVPAKTIDELISLLSLSKRNKSNKRKKR